MSWHVDSELLERYARGDVDDVHACSIEAHLPSCSHCRAQISGLDDGAGLARIWEGIEERLDAPARGPFEAALTRLGVAPHIARLLAATPALRMSWLSACALVLAFAAVAAGQRADGAYWFVVMAPLLPLAGVAAAYGPGVDPTYEIGLAAPMRSFELLLIRALAVLVTTTAMVAIAAIVLSGLHWTAAAWLLPSLGLTLASLALAARASPVVACGSLAALWVLSAGAGGRLAEDPFVFFGAAGQLTCALVAVIALLALLRSAERFERRGDLR